MFIFLGTQMAPNLIGKTWSILESFKPSPNNPYAFIYPIIGLMVLFYPTTIFFTKAFQKFKTEEKKTMSKMVRILFPNVEFTQGALPPIKEVVKSKLFAGLKETSPIYSYGQIRSRAVNTETNIADLGIIEKNTKNTFLSTLLHIPILNMVGVLYQSVFKNIASNKLADNTNYSFRGMFCWMHFKKQLNGHTVLLPKGHVKQFERWVNFNFKEEQQVHLEDPRFTKAFMVFATDQVGARYVVTPALMERIVSIKENFNRPIFLSFQNKQMFLAVENENGLFSFSSGRLDDIKVIEELAQEISMALEVSKELKTS
jgi:hypothetical protein